MYPSPIGVAAFRRKKWNKSSSLSSPQKRREWGWAFRSAVPSLSRIKENSGPRTMPTVAQRSTSPCLLAGPPSPTVFVVDDYAPVRSAVSRLLRAAGFAVAAFASPEKFLAQYDPHTPGCLVLDLDMPAVHGLELQRILATKGSVLPR